MLPNKFCVPVEIYGGGGGYGMVILEKITKSLPLGWTNICVPLLYGHIFFIGLDLGQYSDIFH